MIVLTLMRNNHLLILKVKIVNMKLNEIEKILLVTLWKSSVKELINNKNYDFKSDIIKIAFSLVEQKIGKEDLILLENKNWIVIEVESIMKESTAQELELYLKSRINEIERDIDIFSISHPENNSKIKSTKNNENFDSLLNE